MDIDCLIRTERGSNKGIKRSVGGKLFVPAQIVNGIIGGADWPTFLFLLETKFLWLAVCGILGCAAGIVLILLNSVKKDR